MKKLILVRHAKSDWGNELLKDIDRPLNQRGYSDAYFMSDWFLKSKPLPDCVVSSTAARALNTALIFMRTFEALTEKLNLEPDLYECSVDTLLKIASKTPEAAGTVMIFGHNPAITNFCNKMIREFFIDNVPTCGIVGINFSVDSWNQLGDAQGELDFYQFPKDFRNTD